MYAFWPIHMISRNANLLRYDNICLSFFQWLFHSLSTSFEGGERVDKSFKFYAYVRHSFSWRENTKKYFNLWILHNLFIISKTGSSLAHYVMLKNPKLYNF